MLKKIVAGVDGRAGGADAAALAAALAGPQTDVLLAGVYRDPLLPLPITFSGRDGDAQTATERMVGEVRDAHAPQARTTAVCDSFPARALRHFAEREHADLLVLGSTHRLRGGTAALGRRGRQVLQDAACPVAVAARGFAAEPGRPRRVVVGFDGSPEARAALELAATLADGDESRIVFVAVADDTLPTVIMPAGVMVEIGQWEQIVDERRARAERMLSRVAGDARRAAEVRVGDPAEELASAAAGADLLVIGSRRWGALARVVVGSTAETLLRQAPCSMLMVPRPAEVEPAPAEGDEAAGAEGGIA
jgi:nucleotide-binding universal stress UspA family protein